MYQIDPDLHPSFDPTEPGLRVRLRDNPGKCGLTTGRIKVLGPRTLVQIFFGPNETQYKPLDQLELQGTEEDPWDMLHEGSFSQYFDLRRLLTYEKLQGDLTNIFYSMDSSNTDFYPHQFKPVLKFIESPNGRLLIADEVGLGKTIEAVYIWKELQVREGAERLLVVCPAMLREKWQLDLRTHFGIDAELVGARALRDRLDSYHRRKSPRTFALITSLEGIRPPAAFREQDTPSTRAEIARLLDQYAGFPEVSLLDLVIIDEAHYLRNPNTANHRLGELLRDASRHLLLLTATPIQTDKTNFFQLLRLIDPTEFFNDTVFHEMLEANRPLVDALRHLWHQPPDLAGARACVRETLTQRYFQGDSRLLHIQRELDSLTESDHPGRVHLGKQLESLSLLDRFMTRSLKRQVLQKRITRAAQTIFVPYTDLERLTYEAISRGIQDQTVDVNLNTLRLISRQRQMASSLAASLRHWQKKGILDEFLWEDFGINISSELDEEKEGAEESDCLPGLAEESEWPSAWPAESNIRLADLEKFDTKYNKLKEFFDAELRKNPREKFVLFAFFRGTLLYLEQRLKQDGVPCALILGGMGEAKLQVLRQFRLTDGPNVLLSSEVGSEGIDLQFSRFIINYDLPWNPMRVEQRIGRLDRLGQRAEKISIINFALGDTIEERILNRLYERIRVFEQSIGDLEEILGIATQQLLHCLFDPHLSSQEREEQANQTIMALERQRDDQQQLEQEAINLFAFSDYLLESISSSRAMGRLLHPSEVIFFVQDFFRYQYPGTELKTNPQLPGFLEILLAPEARVALHAFIQKQRPVQSTRLHLAASPVPCLFDFRTENPTLPEIELINSQHPLLVWIRSECQTSGRQFHRVAAIKAGTRQVELPAGDYAFNIHEWSFSGLRKEKRLVFLVKPVSDAEPLDEELSEIAIAQAMVHGETFPNARNVLGDLCPFEQAALACEETLLNTFDAALEEFQAENESRCNIQEHSARSFAGCRRDELLSRLQRYREKGMHQVIPMTEGLLRRLEEELQVKLKQIGERREVTMEDQLVAVGVLRVEQR